MRKRTKSTIIVPKKKETKRSLEEALKIAKQIVNKQNPKIVAIPDGVSVIVTKD